MSEYKAICSTINSKETRLKEIKKEVDEIQSDLNTLYQRQSELFSKMMDEELQ